jgi:hypothetical protein
MARLPRHPDSRGVGADGVYKVRRQPPHTTPQLFRHIEEARSGNFFPLSSAVRRPRRVSIFEL